VNASESSASTVRDQVGGAAADVQEKARETAQEARVKASDRVREEVDVRSTQAGEQARSVAQAMRRSSEQLRGEQKETPAKLLDGSAERAERLGSYLEQSSGDDILRDVEDFARRQPWLVAAGAFALGVAASRFLKASSSRRYQESDAAQFTQRQGFREYPEPRTASIPPAPAVPPAPALERPSRTPSEGY
jgi:hypothetical protein